MRICEESDYLGGARLSAGSTFAAPLAMLTCQLAGTTCRMVTITGTVETEPVFSKCFVSMTLCRSDLVESTTLTPRIT